MDIKIEYKTQLRKWQAKAIESMERFTVIVVHRRGGKTFLALDILITYALQKKGKYVYIAPYLKQAKQIAWSLLKEKIAQFQKIDLGNGKRFDYVDIRESELLINFGNGSTIQLLGSDNPDAIRGNALHGVILDEVADMPTEIWSVIVMPTLMNTRGFAIFIGTPHGTNLFSDLFFRAQAGKKSWSALSFDVYHTDALTQEEIELAKSEMSENEFKQEFMCDFSVIAHDQLISLQDCQMSTQRIVDENTNKQDYKLIMGVDVARYGNDASCIFLRRGDQVLEPYVFRGYSTYQLALEVKLLKDKYNADIIYVDGTGVGGGVVDTLQHLGVFVYEVNFSQRAISQEYVDKRTEIWFKLKEFIKSTGSLPNNQDLIKDLTSPIYEKNDKGQFKLESKKLIKKRLGYSPDLGDALALTFAGYESEYNDDYINKIYINRYEKPKTFSQIFESEIENESKRMYI